MSGLRNIKNPGTAKDLLDRTGLTKTNTLKDLLLHKLQGISGHQSFAAESLLNNTKHSLEVTRSGRIYSGSGSSLKSSQRKSILLRRKNFLDDTDSLNLNSSPRRKDYFHNQERFFKGYATHAAFFRLPESALKGIKNAAFALNGVAKDAESSPRGQYQPLPTSPLSPRIPASKTLSASAAQLPKASPPSNKQASQNPSQYAAPPLLSKQVSQSGSQASVVNQQPTAIQPSGITFNNPTGKTLPASDLNVNINQATQSQNPLYTIQNKPTQLSVPTQSLEQFGFTPTPPNLKPSPLSPKTTALLPTTKDFPTLPPALLARPLKYYDDAGSHPKLYAGKMKLFVPTGVDSQGKATGYDAKQVFPPYRYVKEVAGKKLVPVYSGDKVIALVPAGPYLKQNNTARARRRGLIPNPPLNMAQLRKQTAYNPPSKKDLAVHLEFDQFEGDLLLDTSGHENNAHPSGSATRMVANHSCGMAERLIGGQIEFDGEKFAPKPKSAVSIAVWIKLKSSKGRQSIFYTVGGGQYNLASEDGKIVWSHIGDDNNVTFRLVTLNEYLQPNKWAHIAATYDAVEGECHHIVSYV